MTKAVDDLLTNDIHQTPKTHGSQKWSRNSLKRCDNQCTNDGGGGGDEEEKERKRERERERARERESVRLKKTDKQRQTEIQTI